MVEWNKKIEIFGNTKDKDKRRKYFKKLIEGKEDKIIEKISQNIELL